MRSSVRYVYIFSRYTFDCISSCWWLMVNMKSFGLESHQQQQYSENENCLVLCSNLVFFVYSSLSILSVYFCIYWVDRSYLLTRALWQRNREDKGMLLEYIHFIWQIDQNQWMEYPGFFWFKFILENK
jgi:hypothetical protein